MLQPASRARQDLHDRLQARRGEIEQAVLTRVCAVSDPSDPSGAADAEYTEGIRVAVTAAIDYGLKGVIARGEQRPPSIPLALLAQARIAARRGVSLEIVLRRYFGGYALLGDFLIEEAERRGLIGDAELKLLLRAQAALFDHLIAVISGEYGRERGSQSDTLEKRRAERIRRLLAGELLDTSGLAYDFEAHHLAIIASGLGDAKPLRELATALDRRLLTVRLDESTTWAWLGGRRQLEIERLVELTSAQWPIGAPLAIGESGEGLGGWRLSHQQARAALPIAMRSAEVIVRYADVALLASMLQDAVLSTSLRQLYLAPLARERDGGKGARTTLRAYFAADRNAASAAAALGVSRQAVTKRLRSIERKLTRPLPACAMELEAALRMEDFKDLPQEA